MNREVLLYQLQQHQSSDEHEAQMQRRIVEFVISYHNCHSRELAIGHLTGSAWIVDEARAHALLLHHGKLNKWLQPGGHVEDDAEMLVAAWREARGNRAG